MFVRKCQECGNLQESKPINEYKGNTWMDTKCKKCKSMALDYGHDGYTRDTNGKIVREQSDYDTDYE